MWKIYKEAGALCISALLLSTLLFQRLTLARSTVEEEIEYYIKSKVVFSNKGSRVWNFTEREDDRTIGLFMNNSWQTVYLVNSTPPIEAIKSDKDGNKVAVLQFPEALQLGKNISSTVIYHVISKPRVLENISENASGTLNEISDQSLKEKYLGAEGPWLINETMLKNIAHNIAGNEINILRIVKNFVSWIKKNINYPSQMHEVPQYPNETVIKHEGDCDDQAILLVTLCRIVGIPAFLQIGAIYLRDQASPSIINYWNSHVTVVQKKIGWHGWAMVYIQPWGWLPVDLTFVFDNIDEDPLNAIENAAVTWQGTIQYMNISQTDYVASSLEARDFLQNNKFYVYEEEEMTEVTYPEGVLGEGLGRAVCAAFLIAAGGFLITGSYLLSRRWVRKKKEEIPP